MERALKTYRVLSAYSMKDTNRTVASGSVINDLLKTNVSHGLIIDWLGILST